MNAQAEIPGVETVPGSLVTTLRDYGSAIETLSLRMKRLDKMDANEVSSIGVGADRAAKAVHECVMGLRQTHQRTEWFLRLFGSKKVATSDRVERHRGVASRLLLILGGGLRIDVDPSRYHAPIDEAERPDR